MLNVIGSPNEHEIEAITRRNSKTFLKSLEVKPAAELEKLFPDASKVAVDLLEQMLVFDPTKRITVEAALEHPYFSNLHCLEDEVSFRIQPTTLPVSRFDFLFESQPLVAKEFRDLVFDEIKYYYFPESMKDYHAQKMEYE